MEFERHKNILTSDWSYLITHKSVYDFKVNDDVFLKGYPAHRMSINHFQGDRIVCVYYTIDGVTEYCVFKPEMLLPYKFAGLMVCKNKFLVCLN